MSGPMQGRVALSCLRDFQLAKLCVGLCRTRNEVVCDIRKVDVIFAKGAGFNTGSRARWKTWLKGATILAHVITWGELERHMTSLRVWHMYEQEFKTPYKV